MTCFSTFLLIVSIQFLGQFFGQTFAQIPYEKDYLSESQKEQLKTILEDAIDAQVLPSVVAAATLNDRVIWARGIGYADRENKIPPKVDEHLYRWASVSKVATERFAQAMEESGILDQDAPISKYIAVDEPSFLRRCFISNDELNKFIGCTKNYGGFGPIVMLQGFPRCFNPSTFSEMELSKGDLTFTVKVQDTSVTTGKVSYKNEQGQTKCSASYSMGHAYVSSSKITLNHLLNHTSGILHYDYLAYSAEPPVSEIANVQKIASRKAQGKSQMEWAIPYFYPKHPLLFLPGVGRSYSTFGYNLAGVVMERASQKTFDELLGSYRFKIGALSMQPDYLGLKPAGPYERSQVYRRSDGKFKLYPYDTDNSYKLAGGGIQSTIVSLAKFCAAVGKDGMITQKGRSSYSHSGAHANRSKSQLTLKTSASGDRQCLVLMTNTEHSKVDLPELSKKLESKLISLGAWSKY